MTKQLARREKNSALGKAKFWKSIGAYTKRVKWVKAALINRAVEHGIKLTLDN
jgi:hypothetical protein